MDNYNLQFRIWAKIVAFVDLILSIVGLTSAILLTVLAGAVTETVINSDNPADVAAVAWFVWLAVGILAIITLVNLWASVQLIKATEFGRAASESIKFSESWRTVAIIFLVLNLFCDIVMGSYTLMVIQLLVRGTFIYIVYRFIQELQIYVGVKRQVNV